MIYDCFTFFDEFLLLELRLRILDDVVDRFVLAEADRTHQGASKPLHFAESRDRFAHWNERIIHVPVRDLPDGRQDAWAAERHQRLALARGLDGLPPDALVVVSDVDEIPDPAVLARLEKDLQEPVSLQMAFFYYRFNLLVHERWRSAKAARWGCGLDPAVLRTAKDLPIVPRAGWHFSYLGSREVVQRKIQAFAHTEYNTGRYLSPTHIDRAQELGVDLYGRFVLSVVDHDRLPEQVRHLRRDLPELFHPGRPPTRTLLAHAYRFTSARRDRIPNAFSDGHPIPAFFAAVGLWAHEWWTRLVRRLTRSRRRMVRRRRVRRGSRLIITRRNQSEPISPAPLPDSCVILSSYRVDSEARLELLRTVVPLLARQLGDEGDVSVRDSSPPGFRELTARTWRETGLRVQLEFGEEPMVTALQKMLDGCQRDWFYLQFDDMLTIGLEPGLLESACGLLRLYADRLHVMAVPGPLDIELDRHSRTIRLVNYERTKDGLYRFAGWPAAARPVAVEKVGDRTFGIFENLGYGFFFNHLVASVEEFRRRLAWFSRHVSASSVHEIELAAKSGLRGPCWTHVAFCLDDVGLLDLDVSHTAAAVRGVKLITREVFDAVRDGWDVETVSRSL